MSSLRLLLPRTAGHSPFRLCNSSLRLLSSPSPLNLLSSFPTPHLLSATPRRRFCVARLSQSRPPQPVLALLMDLQATKLDYFSDMHKLQSTANFLSHVQTEDDRHALILDSTIFHPQGGGQPFDTGFITSIDGDIKFVVQDVRSKDGIVFHYGFFDTSEVGAIPNLKREQEVCLHVDGQRRVLNARLHSAGHLLDICMKNVGLALEPTKGYHFPDGPFVEYKGTIAQNELQSKQKELEMEANNLISKGGKVSAAVLPYSEASEMCGGSLPDYIPESSTPRIVKFGDNPGCPCGGTHVADIADIRNLKVTQIRAKKGLTKVSYRIDL